MVSLEPTRTSFIVPAGLIRCIVPFANASETLAIWIEIQVRVVFKFLAAAFRAEVIQFAFIAPGHSLFSIDVLTADGMFDHVPHPSFRPDMNVMGLARLPSDWLGRAA